MAPRARWARRCCCRAPTRWRSAPRATAGSPTACWRTAARNTRGGGAGPSWSIARRKPRACPSWTSRPWTLGGPSRSLGSTSAPSASCRKQQQKKNTKKNLDFLGFFWGFLGAVVRVLIFGCRGVFFFFGLFGVFGNGSLKMRGTSGKIDSKERKSLAENSLKIKKIPTENSLEIKKTPQKIPSKYRKFQEKIP